MFFINYLIMNYVKTGYNKYGNTYYVYGDGQYSYDNENGSYYSHLKDKYSTDYIDIYEYKNYYNEYKHSSNQQIKKKRKK